MISKAYSDRIARSVYGARSCRLLRSNSVRRDVDGLVQHESVNKFRRLSAVNEGVWTSNSIRQKFIQYFEGHGHSFVPSTSVIPKKDSGTYFVNAGMNQFKSVLLGETTETVGSVNLTRAVNSQRCIRVGGKHNDLDEVGTDTYHHTFFEMLGNWSFGDYFKAEACRLAWQLLTDTYGIPAERLYVTYFAGDENLGLSPDTETRDIWLSLGLKGSRVLPYGSKDNFWEMAETGPCGPCTEIHYDYVGDRDASALVNSSAPDVIELWNLVFIQFNRVGTNQLRPLPSRHVDTGMGLERLCTVLQGVNSNYDTDLFRPVLDVISQSCPVPAYSGKVGRDDRGGKDAAFRTVADHARMYTVAIADGLLPSAQSEGSGHKLRQIMYRSFRALRRVLCAPPGVAASLVDPVVDTLGLAYPQLSSRIDLIKDVVSNEESNYLSLLSNGYEVLRQLRQRKNSIVELLSASDLQDIAAGRYGEIPSLDIIYDIAEECGIKVQRGDIGAADMTPASCDAVNRGSNSTAAGIQPVTVTSGVNCPPSLGFDLQQMGFPATDDALKYAFARTSSGHYEFPEMPGTVLALWSCDVYTFVTRAEQPGSSFFMVLDKTGFYAEAGGQVADTGSISNSSFKAEVHDVQRVQNYIVHRCNLISGAVSVGDAIIGRIDEVRRLRCMVNHTATHLLNSALRKALGADVRQCGSFVGPDKLTLAFSCTTDAGLSHLRTVEETVRTCIAAGVAINVDEQALSTVREAGDRVTLLQEETYPSQVRVVAIGAKVEAVLHSAASSNDCVSAELCCGTHVLNSADIGDFTIVNFAGSSQGTKRLTAVTGDIATEALSKSRALRESALLLLEDVTTGTDESNWEERLRDINKVCSEDLLPKVAREEILDFLATSRLHEKVRRASNARLHVSFEEVVSKQLQNQREELVAVVACDFSEAKEASKFLRKMAAARPTALISEVEGRKLTVVCYAPQQLTDAGFLASWAAEVAARLGEGRFGPAKGKNMHLIYVVQAVTRLPSDEQQRAQDTWQQQRATSVVRAAALELLHRKV